MAIQKLLFLIIIFELQYFSYLSSKIYKIWNTCSLGQFGGNRVSEFLFSFYFMESRKLGCKKYQKVSRSFCHKI